MKRERSYHDLTQDEKARYDVLRAEQKKLSFRVAKPYDKTAYQEKKAEADAMLGLRPEKTEEEFEAERRAFVPDSNYKPWRGSATSTQPSRVPPS